MLHMLEENGHTSDKFRSITHHLTGCILSILCLDHLQVTAKAKVICYLKLACVGLSVCYIGNVVTVCAWYDYSMTA